MTETFTKFYEIAKIVFSIETPYEYLDNPPYDLFSAGETAADVRYVFSLVDTLPTPSGKLIFEGPNYRAYSHDGKIRSYIGFYSSGRELDPPFALAVYEADGSVIEVMIPKDRDVPKNASFVYRALCFEHLIASKCGLLLHSSFIKTDRGAILFTAPSGTGKSTQAELWEKYRGAEQINGDCSIVRYTDNAFTAYSLPFSGTSGVCKNDSAPLRAVVYLTQASKNKIARLAGAPAFTYFMEGLKLHKWNRSDVKKVTSTLGDLLGDVPFFKLDCVPDESAVECLEEEIAKYES